MAKSSKSNLRSGIIIFVSILFAVFSFYGYQILLTANFQVKKKDNDTVFYIKQGATYEQVVDSLKKKDILHDVISFRFLAKLMGYPEKITPGAYLIKKDDNNLGVLKRLIKGRQATFKLTFNNIRLKEDFAKKVESQINLRADSLYAALNNQAVCKKYGFDTSTIMCMFIPNTYEVYWYQNTESFLDKMFKEYDKFWTVARQEKAKEMGLTPIQVQILASIVEAETNQKSEKPRIAGVYFNRYLKKQKLQADPTVKFALKQFDLKRIYFGHLETDNPYNTYKYVGLPPGPINIPSIVSIESVLNYEKHDYYFFCADLSTPGYHKFAKNFNDHLLIAKEYRTKSDSLKIK
ncbi:MAG: endolytic transglycosylase MltG [Cytophagales bacterium]